MGKRRNSLSISFLKDAVGRQYNHLAGQLGQQVTDLIELPLKVVCLPIALAFDIAGSAPRGFGIPELISRLSASSVVVIAALGTYDVALEMGKKLICQRNCGACNGWQALRCTMCRGSGKVQFQVKDYTLRSGEKATAECIADAIFDNRAELVNLPVSMNFSMALPSKDCPNCDATGVMGCPECKDKLPFRISADNIMEPPWKAYNVMRKMDYPYEHIVDSMKDPSIAAFWLFSYPRIVGGFDYDDSIKQKIWLQYKESMRYDQFRNLVAKREPGWEYFQEALISVDPARAKEDPVIVKNIPYYNAKKTLEAAVMKLDPPPRPENWGELDLPLDASSWSEEDLKNPKRFYEMTVLLNAQREIGEKILDSQWEKKWRHEKLNEMLEEKVRPYVQPNGILSHPIIMQSQDQEKQTLQKSRKKRWWFF